MLKKSLLVLICLTYTVRAHAQDKKLYEEAFDEVQDMLRGKSL